MSNLLRVVAFVVALFGAPAFAWAGNMTLLGAGKPPSGVVAKSIVTAHTAMQYLTTTWTHAPTDSKKATIAYWLKYTAPGSLGPDNYLFTTALTGGVLLDHKYDGSSHYKINDDGGGSAYAITDNGTETPDSNWHHICIQIDTTQATPVHFWFDRVDNGTIGTQPAANSNMGVTANGIKSYIGEVDYQVGSSTGIPDAKFGYVYLIDGQALTPSSFTTGTGAGSIHPITYIGTYGANGFFLNGNGSSLTDQSGNSNNWTAPNGVSFSTDLPMRRSVVHRAVCLRRHQPSIPALAMIRPGRPAPTTGPGTEFTVRVFPMPSLVIIE